MIEKGSPKSTTRKIEREALVLPTKNISIKTFFNEKVANEHTITYLHCSNSSFRNQSNIIQNRYKTAPFMPQSAHSANSFSVGFSAKNKNKKHWRNATNSVRFVGSMRRKSLIATASAASEPSKQEYSGVMAYQMSKNKLLSHSGIEMVRKQLQVKFNRTRIILREEQKMQRYEKIQNIYENKYKMKNRVKGEQGRQRLQRVQSRESTQYCSPWNRIRGQGLDTMVELQPKFIQISH